MSRAFEVAIGLVLGVVVFFCLIGSVSLFLGPHGNQLMLKYAIASVMVLLSIWLLAVCARLIVGRRVASGLLGPRALRVIAWFFLLLPLAGLFTGYFFTHTLQALAQTAIYVSIFFSLRALALKRAKSEAGHDPR